MKAEKKPQFKVDRNMIPIYRGLYKRYKDGFPEVFIFDELYDEKNILHRDFGDGRRAYFLKDNTDENILSLLYEELESPKCEQTDIPICYHKLSDKEVATYLIYACMIADSLNIPLKQIMFIHGEGEGGYSENFVTLIEDDMISLEMLAQIAHELRHAWQHKHHPDWFDEYIHPEEGITEYQNQISEIDAEAFGIKAESIISGIEFINTYAGLELEPTYREKIIDRMKQIDVVLSNRSVNLIRELIDLDGMINSIKK